MTGRKYAGSIPRMSEVLWASLSPRLCPGNSTYSLLRKPQTVHTAVCTLECIGSLAAVQKLRRTEHCEMCQSAKWIRRPLNPFFLMQVSQLTKQVDQKDQAGCHVLRGCRLANLRHYC